MLKGHQNVVRCLQYDEKVVISGSSDHTVKLVHSLSLSACCTSSMYRYAVSIHIDAELTTIGVHVDSYFGLPELQVCCMSYCFSV